jgi:acyl-CoA thioester hydrolase
LETGRVEVLYDENTPVLAENCSFVIASLNLNYLHEIRWPGTVDVGTGVTKLGSSSIRLYQHIFQSDILVATAETVIVQVSNHTKKSSPLSEEGRERLLELSLNLDS